MPLEIMFPSERGAVVERYEKRGSKVKLDNGEKKFIKIFLATISPLAKY